MFKEILDLRDQQAQPEIRGFRAHRVLLDLQEMKGLPGLPERVLPAHKG